MKLFSTRPLNDGTKGFRFDVMGIKGLCRKRKIQRRFGLDMSGDTFAKLHIGKRSVYFELLNPQRKLYDFALLQHIRAAAKYIRNQVNA